MSTTKKPTAALPKIQRSTNYSEFAFLQTNRPIDTENSKYRDLFKSMKKLGWVPSFPATVFMKNGKKFLIDGQNRFTAAKEQGKAIIYVVVDVNYDIPDLVSSFRAWSSNDFAASIAAKGNAHYVKLVEFHKKHGISANRAACLLLAREHQMRDSSGSATAALRAGTFKFTESGRLHAETVLRVCSYLPKKLRKNRAANAAIARICLVDEINVETLIQKITSNNPQIIPKITVDDYLHLFEDIYNKRNTKPVAVTLRVLEAQRKKAA